MSNLSQLSVDGNVYKLWSEHTQDLVNKHINIEMKNFSVYEALASMLDNGEIGLVGLAKFFRQEADEELKHARDFINYQNKRGGKVKEITYYNPDISHLWDSNKLIIDVYTIALELEKQTNKSLEELHENVNDVALQDMIEGYLNEQHDTQKKLNDVIKLLSLGGDVYAAIHEKELR